MWRRLWGRLGQRAWLGAVIIALGLGLHAPSLTTGLVADDWVHEVVAEGRPLDGQPTSRLDLFSFASTPARTLALVDRGVFPWWADPTTRLAFFRPLTSLSHQLDYRLWPHSPVAMHLQNLAWFALALWLLGRFYRRHLPGGVALLALLLYAVDDAHGPAVGWVANRNAMMALAVSLPSLIWYDRWRREGWRWGAWLSPLGLAVGLLAGEAALATVAYLVAYALHLDKRRWLPLLPSLGVVLAWMLTYRALGFGAAGSGVYIDPGAEPVAFLSALFGRATALWAGQFALPWSDLSTLYAYLSPRLATIMSVVTVVVCGLVVLGFVGLWRRDPVARFFATGAVLATVPVCSTFPADRLLFFVGIGAMGLVAQLLAEPARGPLRLWVGVLVVIHLVLAPPLLLLRSRSMLTVEAPLARAERSIPSGPEVRRQTVVLVNPPSDLFAGYVLLTRHARGTVEPERLRWLASTRRAVTVTRVDERTLVVRPEGGFAEQASEQMLRSPRHPLEPGQQLGLTGVQITLGDGDARFVFDRPLEDPSLVWLRWDVDRYRPFTLPPLGSTVTLPSVDFLRAVFAPTW